MNARNVTGNGSWRIAKLGDVCEKITDGTHHSPSNGQTGEFKYVTAKNIRPSGLDLTDITYVDAATHREIYSRCDVRKDDILYVKDGATTGRVALNTLEEEFSLLSSVGVLRPNRRCILPKYLLYALQTPTVKDRMLADVAGVAITRLTLKKLKAAEIPLAPLDQQDYIVAKLEKQFSRLDEAVANLKRVKASISRYREAALSEAAGSDGRWPTCGLADLLRERIVNGLSVKESTTPTPVRALRLSAMSESGLNYADHRFLPIDPTSVDDILVAEGDFFVSRGNGSLALVGRGATAKTPPFPVIFPDTMMRLRFTDAEVARWVATVWPSRLVRRQIEQRVKTTAGIYKIAQPQVASIRLPLPPTSERERIVAELDRRLSIVRESEAEVDENLKRAQSLRQAVLGKAFSM